jgi:hypothetical protein
VAIREGQREAESQGEGSAVSDRRERATPVGYVPVEQWDAAEDRIDALAIEVIALRAVAEAARAACPSAALLGKGTTMLAVDVQAMRALRSALATLDCAGEETSGQVPVMRGGEPMRAAGEKPDPLGPTGMGGDRSDNQSYSKRATSAGLGREPQASDEVADPKSGHSSGDPDDERARAFWRWFRHTPAHECSDHACDVKLAALLAEVRAEERKRFERVLYCARAMSERYGHKHWGYCGVEYDSEEHASLADSLQEYDESCSAKAKDRG